MVCVCVHVCLHPCMFKWLFVKVCTQVPDPVCVCMCVCVSDYACIAGGRMYARQSAYLLTNQTHATRVCIVAVTLLPPKTHQRTHTHTGWHLGLGLHWQHAARVWYPHKEADSCNPDSALGEFVCMCAYRDETQSFVLSGLRNARFSPASSGTARRGDSQRTRSARTETGAPCRGLRVRV